MTMQTHCQLGLIADNDVERIDLRTYQWLWPFFRYSSEYPIYFGKGLPTMRKKVIFNFDFPQTILPVIEVNQISTAQGSIKLKVDDLEEVSTLTAVIYKVTPPDSANDNWTGTGSDLYTTDVLYLANRKLSDGTNVIDYRFDSSAIVGTVYSGDFYGIRIKVNAGDVASVAQAGPEIIMKITDMISEP